MNKLLHVGCGSQTKAQSTKIFETDNWDETRLDIDESIDPKPDIIGSLTDMSMISDSSYDAIYSSHNIEHLYPHEVEIALNEFNRVLKPNGEVFIACPDLQGVSKHVAEGNLLGTLYESPAGPIAAIDIIYGHRSSLAKGQHYMAHRCGFTLNILIGILKNCNFPSAIGVSDGLNMWVNCVKEADKIEYLKDRLNKHMDATFDYGDI
ncbi:MAG: SAM-dependent methyltransferase [Euryarchaeota archaeon]|nr:SAM-dependent methyltransferase [Euryarchaeota archaeon]|tara:strand:+ start:500 stop:1120 length:621 start_codon:yes stop_codon:yes gene_type:complete